MKKNTKVKCELCSNVFCHSGTDSLNCFYHEVPYLSLKTVQDIGVGKIAHTIYVACLQLIIYGVYKKSEKI